MTELSTRSGQSRIGRRPVLVLGGTAVWVALVASLAPCWLALPPTASAAGLVEPAPAVWLVQLAGVATVGWGAALHAVGAGRSILPASVVAAVFVLAAALAAVRVLSSGWLGSFGFDVGVGLLLIVPLWGMAAGLLGAGVVASWLVRRWRKRRGSQG
jgi:hypothetical protein